MVLGEYLKKIREKKSLSLRETAKRADMSSSYLSQLENGRNSKPDAKILARLSNVLDVPYIDLVQKTDFFKSVINKEADKHADKIIENYEYVRKQKGLTIYNEYSFDLEKLFSEDTTIKYKDAILNKEDKEKIISIIETILK